MTAKHRNLNRERRAERRTDAESSISEIDDTRLSRREQQIIAKLLDGCTNREIAEHLGVSDQTVKVQLTTLYRKIGVNGRLELVVRVMQQPRR